MHDYLITDLVTGEQTKLVAPNRNAALKAHVARRLVVARLKPADKLAQKIVDVLAGDEHAQPLYRAPDTE